MIPPVGCAPELEGLLDENHALAASFKAWTDQFPDSVAYLSPLNPIWRTPAPESELPADREAREALNLWVGRLFEYLKTLELYYLDVLDRPDKLQRFRLMDLIYRAGAFAGSHILKGENCIPVLASHEGLLLIEKKKQEDAWHGVFRQLLHEAMSKCGHSIGGAAEEMGVDRGTLGDYLGGTRNSLKPETKIKMRNYILTHCPHAKQQIQQLGL